METDRREKGDGSDSEPFSCGSLPAGSAPVGPDSASASSPSYSVPPCQWDSQRPVPGAGRATGDRKQCHGRGGTIAAGRGRISRSGHGPPAADGRGGCTTRTRRQAADSESPRGSHWQAPMHPALDGPASDDPSHAAFHAGTVTGQDTRSVSGTWSGDLRIRVGLGISPSGRQP